MAFDGTASAAGSSGLYEPEGMLAVRAKYAELGGVVGTFSEKVGDVLSRAEVQFLQAYRGHMQEVRARFLCALPALLALLRMLF
jgi:hypothetical protein